MQSSPCDVMFWYNADEVPPLQDLVEAVLNLMGLKAEAVGENDNLAALGIDSMQLMEVRAVMQKKLCRPIPLEMIGSLTVATLRELAAEAGSKGGRSSAPPADEVPPCHAAHVPGRLGSQTLMCACVQCTPALAPICCRRDCCAFVRLYFRRPMALQVHQRAGFALEGCRLSNRRRRQRRQALLLQRRLPRRSPRYRRHPCRRSPSWRLRRRPRPRRLLSRRMQSGPARHRS